ncbi:unnamed protein product [Aphanomyces euteiches]|uniref:Uncharacterized protein n=1 Tax=Aphanomyces euteiches TaxID=100861 RepID=A0A6G0WN70_9STRA|nr:hypothetical protein Ae201684_013372 [Aphanomyces euteiches]KAH9062912.1 hypothetical protein Ae201684P_009178 [Aphanomyces euteiches]KAH9156466.1 hypothetical protein AeRB84_001630 [Aphanomyces euteiches]
MSGVLPFPTLAMHRSDRIRLFNFPNEATQWITDAVVASTWPHKDVAISHKDTYVEFKLGGYPWLPNGEDTVHARRLMQQILFTFRTNGYALYTSTGIFNNELSKDILIFEQREPCTLSMFSISLNQHDTLRVIDAPHDIVELITTCIQTNYAGGSVRVSEYTPGCQQFKLWSSPWFDGLKPFGTMIVAHVFAQLNAAGWRLYATIKQTTKSDKNAKDSWYFVYAPEAKLVGFT